MYQAWPGARFHGSTLIINYHHHPLNLQLIVCWCPPPTHTALHLSPPVIIPHVRVLSRNCTCGHGCVRAPILVHKCDLRMTARTRDGRNLREGINETASFQLCRLHFVATATGSSGRGARLQIPMAGHLQDACHRHSTWATHRWRTASICAGQTQQQRGKNLWRALFDPNSFGRDRWNTADSLLTVQWSLLLLFSFPFSLSFSFDWAMLGLAKVQGKKTQAKLYFKMF